jgi:hypothetical protein
LSLPFGERTAVPRYFIDICFADRRIADEEGIECPTFNAALSEALQIARDMTAVAVKNGQPTQGICIQVCDSQRHALTAVTVDEILRHPHAPKFHDTCENC